MSPTREVNILYVPPDPKLIGRKTPIAPLGGPLGFGLRLSVALSGPIVAVPGIGRNPPSYKEFKDPETGFVPKSKKLLNGCPLYVPSNDNVPASKVTCPDGGEVVRFRSPFETIIGFTPLILIPISEPTTVYVVSGYKLVEKSGSFNDPFKMLIEPLFPGPRFE
jgi:hypothetical protein